MTNTMNAHMSPRYTYVAVGNRAQHTVRIIRSSGTDRAVMYDGPNQGPFTPLYPPQSAHSDWLALSHEERQRVVDETNADPRRRPRRPAVEPPAPGFERVAEFIGQRLVIRDRLKK